MIIEPSQQEFLWFKILQIIKCLPVLKKTRKLITHPQVDFPDRNDTTQLPDDSKHHVGILVKEVLRAIVDDLDETLASSEEHCQILSHLEDIEVVPHVNSSHVNSVFFTLVEEMKSNDSIIESIEEVFS